MDEFGSPISGGIRAVRRNISSSFLRAQRPQADTVTTNLLQQQSLQVTNVSLQLQKISRQISSINFNLNAVKENIILSEQLEKRREDAQRNRERILAEQGLREGKESELEKKIQTALFSPIARIGQKTRGILERVAQFLLTLAGGWLTMTGIDLLQAMTEGNVDKINKLKIKFLGGLALSTGALTAMSIGVKKSFGILSIFSRNVARMASGGLLLSSLLGIRILLGGLVRNADKLNATNGGEPNITDKITNTIFNILDAAFVLDILNRLTGRKLSKFFSNKFKFKGKPPESGQGPDPGSNNKNNQSKNNQSKKKSRTNTRTNTNPKRKLFGKNIFKSFLGTSLLLLGIGIQANTTAKEIQENLDKLEEEGLDTEQNKKEEISKGIGGGLGQIGLGFGIAKVTSVLLKLLVGIMASAGVIIPDPLTTAAGIGLFSMLSQGAFNMGLDSKAKTFGEKIGGGLAGVKNEKKDDNKEEEIFFRIPEDGVGPLIRVDPIKNNDDRIEEISKFDPEDMVEPSVITLNSNAQGGSNVTSNNTEKPIPLPDTNFFDNTHTLYARSLTGIFV